MTKEIAAAMTVLGLFVFAFALFLCKLAFSGLKRRRDGVLSEQWGADRECQRYHRMKSRNEV